MDVALNLTINSKHFTQQVGTSTTLEDVLVYFQVQDDKAFQTAMLQRQDYAQTKFLAFTGVPAKEELGPKTSDGSALVSIQYNVPGLMQPKLTFDNGNTYVTDLY